MRRTTTTIIARWLHCIVAVAALGASSSAIATAAADNCPTGSMAALPPSAYITLNNGLVLCRITTGMWQLSGGHAHRVSESNIDRAVADMAALVRAGFTSFDLADHYGNAEDVVGYFHSAHPELASKAVFMTKWVPQPGPMPESAVLSALDVSRRRMKMATLDLVQFHWWDYADARYMDMVESAHRLVDKQVLRGVALTNFDTTRLIQIADRVPVVSNQVSFSIVDTRPLDAMLPACRQRNIVVVAYGVLLGGLLSERFLNVAQPTTAAQLNTASLKKYMGFVLQWGGWGLFQTLLGVLNGIGKKHNVSLANVAVRWVLQVCAFLRTRHGLTRSPKHDGVVALIGARLGLQVHVEENARVFALTLDEADMQAIADVQRLARRLRGDCGDEYR